jgi:hypothetical protein
MSARACCGNCRHFSNDPVQLESALPGLGALGSAHGAVRDQDGICGKHERYLRASSVCAGHEFTGPWHPASVTTTRVYDHRKTRPEEPPTFKVKY